MITYSGKEFDPEDPRPDQIDLLDIAVGLSRVNRFVGHTAFPFSVAQHSFLVSSLVDALDFPEHPGIKMLTRYRLLGLLHDADEAYTSDIPSPVKSMLKPSIVEVEGRIMDAIYYKSGIAPPTSPELIYIKTLDVQALSIEHINLREAAFVDITKPFRDSQFVPLDCNLVALTFMREFKILLEKYNEL